MYAIYLSKHLISSTLSIYLSIDLLSVAVLNPSSFVIRGSAGIENEAEKRAKRRLGDACGGPGELQDYVWTLWKRFLVFRGCLGEALGSSRGAPGSVLECFRDALARL